MLHLSFAWHPFAVDPAIDYAAEPTTLVAFDLQEVPEGTLLRISESGFAALPADRREQAYQGNEAGWECQAMLVAKYLHGS